MTAATLTTSVCGGCHHPKLAHNGNHGRCLRDGCGCTGMTPGNDQPVPARVTADQLIRDGRGHPSRQIVAAAEKAHAAVVALAKLLADDRKNGEARARIKALEAELAQLRATVGGVLPCQMPGCRRTFTRQQGLTRHLREGHGKGQDA